MTDYNISYTEEDKINIVLTEGTVDNTTDVSLFGRGKLKYGKDMNQNFLNLLEKFACPEDASTPGTPDTTIASGTLLENPIEGQIWFNKTESKPYFWNSTEWVPMGTPNSYSANWGVVGSGTQIPKPVDSDGIAFEYSECAWIVSPYVLPDDVINLTTATDDEATVTVEYQIEGSGTVFSGIANYIIVGIRGNSNLGDNISPSCPQPSPTPTPSVTPTITVTPSIGSSVTPTASPSPTPTNTMTPTPTPTNTRTPTRTVTPTHTVTPTNTVTRTPTPTPTLTVTPTPSTPALAVLISPTVPVATCGYAFCTLAETNCESTTVITAVPSGGNAPYTYAWTKLSGSGSLSGSTTSISATVVLTAAEGDYSGTYRVTVTDASLNVTTGTVIVGFSHLETSC